MRFVCLFLIVCLPAFGATKYLRQGASGTGSGDDWTNAYTTWAAAYSGISRGDTLYVADTSSSLGTITLDKALSGTSTITVKKAIASDHGTETGWSSAYGDGQAQFGEILLETGYWIIDGQTRTESDTWTAPTGYGFKASGVSANSLNGDNGANSQFRYMDLGPNYTTTYSSGWGVVVYLVYNQTDITFHRCAMHNAVGTIVQGAGSDNLTFEYCDIGPGWGKEALRGGNGSISSGWIVRYNRFWNASQTDPDDGSSGITAEIGIWDWTGTGSGIEIYGNVFYNDKSGGRNSIILVGGDGSGWAGGGSDGTLVYNNTFAGMAEDSVFSEIDLNGSSTVARNNLGYDMTGTFSVSASTTSNNTEVGTTPFTNYGTYDFTLSGATAAGTTLSSPYNVDIAGETRGSDGNWDLGAYEYVAGGDVVAPTVSSASIATNGTSITVNFDENVTTGAGGNGGWSATGSTRGAQTMTYSSGTGTTALVFTVPLAFYSIETVTLGYTQPTNGWEDTSGNDLATIVTQATTNNSTQTAPVVTRSVSRAARTGALPFLP